MKGRGGSEVGVFPRGGSHNPGSTGPSRRARFELSATERRENPPGELMSQRVVKLEYEHVAEPEAGHVIRVHKFRRGVSMYALPGGRILLERDDGAPLWTEDGR